MDQTGGQTEINYTPQASGPVQPPVNTPIPAAEPAPQPPNSDSTGIISWNASEFINHQKGSAWFLPLIFSIIAASGLIYLITRNILSTVVVGLGGIVFVVFAYQKPRTLSYALSQQAIQVGEKIYSYDDFRTFSIVQDGALFSVFLEPVRRFMPPLTIYFPAEEGEKIFDALAARIPHEERTMDPVERLMKRLRF